MESIKFYKGNGYGPINKLLRKEDIKNFLKTDDPLAIHILNIDRNMKNNKIGIPLFRGIAGAFIPEAVKQTSGIIVNKAYTSASMSQETVKSFTDVYGCCVIVFVPSPNLKSIIVEYSGEYTESEIIFERNTQFVIDIKKSKHPLYVARLEKWDPPKLTEWEEKAQEKISQAVKNKNKETLLSLYNEVGEKRFLELRKQVYVDEGEDSDDAEDLAEMELFEIN